MQFKSVYWSVRRIPKDSNVSKMGIIGDFGKMDMNVYLAWSNTLIGQLPYPAAWRHRSWSGEHCLLMQWKSSNNDRGVPNRELPAHASQFWSWITQLLHNQHSECALRIFQNRTLFNEWCTILSSKSIQFTSQMPFPIYLISQITLS